MLWQAKVLYALHAPLLRPSKSIRMILRKGNRGARRSLPPSLPPPSPHILDADEETTEGGGGAYGDTRRFLPVILTPLVGGQTELRTEREGETTRLNLAFITRVIDLSPDSPLVCRVPAAATDF